MRKTPSLTGLYARPPEKLSWLLAALPFILVVAVYLQASHLRHLDNPQDKILPTPTQMLSTVERMAFQADRRTGAYLLWSDTLASLKRLGSGVLLAAVVGLLLGLNIAVFPALNSLGHSFLTFFAMIPPLALLPILFISFGVDELAKVVLIFIGIFPVITRDVYLAVRRLPRGQITKALTLGASQVGVVYRIVLPQVVPRLLDAVRLSLGAAWLFLIAGEAIAATEGLGYRIFLVRRYLAMDVIIPYVMWITALGFILDWLLRGWIRWRHPWYGRH
jgi:NitT/TauT family transport system permease protein